MAQTKGQVIKEFQQLVARVSESDLVGWWETSGPFLEGMATEVPAPTPSSSSSSSSSSSPSPLPLPLLLLLLQFLLPLLLLVLLQLLLRVLLLHLPGYPLFSSSFSLQLTFPLFFFSLSPLPLRGTGTASKAILNKLEFNREVLSSKGDERTQKAAAWTEKELKRLIEFIKEVREEERGVLGKGEGKKREERRKNQSLSQELLTSHLDWQA